MELLESDDVSLEQKPVATAAQHVALADQKHDQEVGFVEGERGEVGLHSVREVTR